jgi:hypothetical protein
VVFRVVDGRSRTRARRPHAFSGRPILIYTCHAAPMPRCAMALRNRFQVGMVVARHERGMACVNQTRPHCVNQMGKTQSKPFAARHGSGIAWARHGNDMVCVNWPLKGSLPTHKHNMCMLDIGGMTIDRKTRLSWRQPY